MSGCACPRFDRYSCWSARYPALGRRDDGPPYDEPPTADEVDMDGGPCMCPCHREEEETP